MNNKIPSQISIKTASQSAVSSAANDKIPSRLASQLHHRTLCPQARACGSPMALAQARLLLTRAFPISQHKCVKPMFRASTSDPVGRHRSPCLVKSARQFSALLFPTLKDSGQEAHVRRCRSLKAPIIVHKPRRRTVYTALGRPYSSNIPTA